MPRFSPQEDEVLLPYVDKLCRWNEVLPRLNGRTITMAQQRLSTLRRRHGTLWRVEPRSVPRGEGGRFR